MTSEKDPLLSTADKWLETQRSYWDAWFQYCQTAASQPGSGLANSAFPWSAGLEKWWTSLEKANISPPAETFLQQLVDQGRAFVDFSEKFSGLGAALSGADSSSWQQVMSSKIEELKGFLGQTQNWHDSINQLRGWMPFFELPMDTWNRTVAGTFPFGGDWLRAAKESQPYNEAADHVREQLGRFLAVPGVGYTREWQESAQRSASLTLEYEEAYSAYSNAHGRLGVNTLERMQEKLEAKLKAGDKISSMREVYDIWVDCAEEAYAQFVMTDEYGELYGRLVNALMRMKRHGQQMADEVAGALNLPTQESVRATQKRLQEARRDLSHLRAAVQKLQRERTDGKSGKVAELETTLTALGQNLKDVAAKTSAGAQQGDLETLRRELSALETRLSKVEYDKSSSTSVDELPESTSSRKATRQSAAATDAVKTTRRRARGE